jgi:hypothetical protein
VSGKYAYVLANERNNFLRTALLVIDVSNPANPQRVSVTGDLGWMSALAVSGNLAYVAGPAGGLTVVDISNPANPKRIGRNSMVNFSSGVRISVSGRHAYVVDHGDGLQVFDVSDPTNPKRVATYETALSFGDVTVSGHYAYVAESVHAEPYRGLLHVIDISNPTNPQPVGETQPIGYSPNLAVSGHYAYVTGWDGLEVIDVSDPANLRRVAVLDGIEGRLVASGSQAFVADPRAGLRVIDISDPTNPQRFGIYDTGREAQAVAASGSYAYLWESSDRLQVIDIRNPAHPQWVGGYDTSDWPFGLLVSTTFAYDSDPDETWLVKDVSDPANPRSVGGFKTIASAMGVVVSGRYAYARVVNGLEVIDVSDPTHPQRVGGISGFDAMGVAVHGDKVYVAAGAQGLLILKARQPHPHFEPSFFDAAGFHVVFQGETNQSLRLERSQDLKAWVDWMSVTGTGNRQEVVDPGASSQPRQFYRAVVKP